MTDATNEPSSRRLFHVSDRSDIERFVPRIAPTDPDGRRVVWAVDGPHLGHYLVPRDCPRVCFRAGPASTDADVTSLLGGNRDRRVVAIEAAWDARVRSTTLWRYELPTGSFRLHDAGAGYFVSGDTVVPLAVDRIDDLPGAIAALGYDLVVLPSLRALRDQVVASTLPFSVIRWRYAGG